MIFPTPNLDIVDYPADLRHQSSGHITQYLIVLHATVGTNSKIWLSRDPNSNVSAHRLITKAGVNIKLLDDNAVANTQGFGVMGHFTPSSYTLMIPDNHGNLVPYHVPRVMDINYICRSIEMENMNDGQDPYTEPQLIMTARQCIEWQAKDGLPGAIVSHAMIDNRKDDPFAFPWQHFSGLYWRIVKDYMSVWKP